MMEVTKVNFHPALGAEEELETAGQELCSLKAGNTAEEAL